MQNTKKKVVFPNRWLRKRVVALAVNGKVRLPVLARKIGVPTHKVRRWKQRFAGQIQKRPLKGKQVQKRLDLVQALVERARIQAKIDRLKAAL